MEKPKHEFIVEADFFNNLNPTSTYKFVRSYYYLPEYVTIPGFNWDIVLNELLGQVKRLQNSNEEKPTFFIQCTIEKNATVHDLTDPILNGVKTEGILSAIMMLLDCYDPAKFLLFTGFDYTKIKNDVKNDSKTYAFRLFLHIVFVAGDRIDNLRKKIRNSKLLNKYYKKLKNVDETPLNTVIDSDLLADILKKPTKKIKSTIITYGGDSIVNFFEACRLYAEIQMEILKFDYSNLEVDTDFETTMTLPGYGQFVNMSILKKQQNVPVISKFHLFREVAKEIPDVAHHLQIMNMDMLVKNRLRDIQISSAFDYASILKNCFNNNFWNFVINKKDVFEQLQYQGKNRPLEIVSQAQLDEIKTKSVYKDENQIEEESTENRHNINNLEHIDNSNDNNIDFDVKQFLDAKEVLNQISAVDKNIVGETNFLSQLANVMETRGLKAPRQFVKVSECMNIFQNLVKQERKSENKSVDRRKKKKSKKKKKK